MPIVRALVVAHLGLTAALLLVFALVVLCQRLRSARGSAAAPAAPYPSDAVLPRVEVPEQDAEPRRTAPSAGASVLDWTVDLRTAAGERGALQPSS